MRKERAGLEQTHTRFEEELVLLRGRAAEEAWDRLASVGLRKMAVPQGIGSEG